MPGCTGQELNTGPSPMTDPPATNARGLADAIDYY